MAEATEAGGASAPGEVEIGKDPAGVTPEAKGVESAGPAETGQTAAGTTQEPKGKGAKKTSAPRQSAMPMMIMLGVIVAVMYFLMIRPQQKREKARQGMIGRLKSGDKVVTASGIVGEVVEVGELDVTIKIDPRKDVRMKVRKAAIAGVAGDAGSEQAVKESTGR